MITENLLVVVYHLVIEYKELQLIGLLRDYQYH
jgi:hypothetical protein